MRFSWLLLSLPALVFLISHEPASRLSSSVSKPSISRRGMRIPAHHRHISRPHANLVLTSLTTTTKNRNLACNCESTVNDKTLTAMTNFANRYNKVAGTTYCSDPSIAAVVIKGLAEHKDTLGAPLCPCRHYDDKKAEAEQGFWNCPCVPMRERKECHCMLFLTEDNDFAGKETNLTPEDVANLISNIR
ncbi:hypothetical protein AAMO2058_001128700 [Amorphochlora amoebiformis]